MNSNERNYLRLDLNPPTKMMETRCCELVYCNYSRLLNAETLHTFLDLRFLEFTSWNRSTRLLCVLTMQLQQLAKIKFRWFEDLDLANIDLSSA